MLTDMNSLMWETKGIVIEDFNNYKVPSLFISNSTCTLKCDKINNCNICQNSSLINQPSNMISFKDLANLYFENSLTKAFVFGGLENFDEFEQLYNFITYIRVDCNCDDMVVIQTGYDKLDILNYINILKKYKNIIVKFGAFLINHEKHYDELLGVYLASDNQYAEQIS